MGKERYNYKDIDFCERIIAKKEIQKLNYSVAGIAKSAGYAGSHNVQLMEYFIKGVSEENISKYRDKISPISYFDLPTLHCFMQYLYDIIITWNTKKLDSISKQDSSVSLHQVFQQEAAVVHKIMEQRKISINNISPTQTKLPTHIRNYMYNKALQTLKYENPQKYESYSYLPKETKIKSPKDSVSKHLKTKLKGTTIDIKLTAKTSPTKGQSTPKNSIPSLVKDSDITLFNYSHLQDASDDEQQRIKKAKLEDLKIKYSGLDANEKIVKIREDLSSLYEEKIGLSEKVNELNEQLSDIRYEIKICNTLTQKTTLYKDYKNIDTNKSLYDDELVRVEENIDMLEEHLSQTKRQKAKDVLLNEETSLIK